MNGIPWLSAQPAARPPVVTNVAWARLTIPPTPVTIVIDSSTSARPKPLANRPDQYRSATKRRYTRTAADATNHGITRRRGDICRR